MNKKLYHFAWSLFWESAQTENPEIIFEIK